MELTFKLSLDHTNIILAALGKIPYEAAAPVIDNLRQQAAPQLQVPADQQGTDLPQE